MTRTKRMRGGVLCVRACVQHYHQCFPSSLGVSKHIGRNTIQRPAAQPPCTQIILHVMLIYRGVYFIYFKCACTDTFCLLVCASYCVFCVFPFQEQRQQKQSTSKRCAPNAICTLFVSCAVFVYLFFYRRSSLSSSGWRLSLLPPIIEIPNKSMEF